jgi:hypothetical protein
MSEAEVKKQRRIIKREGTTVPPSMTGFSKNAEKTFANRQAARGEQANKNRGLVATTRRIVQNARQQGKQGTKRTRKVYQDTVDDSEQVDDDSEPPVVPDTSSKRRSTQGALPPTPAIVPTSPLRETCTSNMKVEDLPVYDLFKSSPEPRLSILNTAVKILEQQISNTSRLPPTNSGNPLLQENLFCNMKIEPKTKKELYPRYNGTVRAQGLFKIDEISDITDISTLSFNSLYQLNKLCENNPEIRFAIQASQGNPNGVLAVALHQALKYLDMSSTGLTKEDKDKIKNLKDKNELALQKIFNASRGSKGDEGSTDSFKEDTNFLLKLFLKQINSAQILNYVTAQELLIWITRVYGPFLNKGISDISQAGELAKLYILKYIEERNSQATSRAIASTQIITGRELGQKFWETTKGRPTLSAYSSDKIASALGVRIQNLFEGQFQSVLPRKYEKGRYMVVFIPYKYMSFMRLMEINNIHELSQLPQIPDLDKIWREITNVKIEFTRKVYIVFNCAGIIFSDIFFNNLRILVNDIYIYYKTKNNSGVFFSKNILEIINDIETQPTFSDEETNMLVNITTKFNNLYSITYSKIKTREQSIKKCFETIKSILLFFGEMIEKLYTIFDTASKTGNLTKMMLQEYSSLTPGSHKDLELPSWTGILYSTISYYANCSSFNTKTPNDLLNLYLEISTTEIFCAEQDVDHGHDQTAEQVGELGLVFARDWFNVNEGRNELDLRPLKSSQSSESDTSMDIDDDSDEKKTKEKGHQNDKIFSKYLIDKLQYCSVALTYDRYGNPILKTHITKSADKDFMWDTVYASSIPRMSVTNIKTIGNAEILGSVDYVVGDPDIIASKPSTINPFYTMQSFTDYLNSENIIEIRTPVTNFDAAAPSGAFYKDAEQMCVSYYTFTQAKGSSKNDRKTDTYIYVVLTKDLDNENHKNNLVMYDAGWSKNVKPYDPFGITGGPLKPFTVAFGLETAKVDKGAESKQNRFRINMMTKLINKCYKLPNSKIKQILSTEYGQLTEADISDEGLGVEFNDLLADIKTKLDGLYSSVQLLNTHGQKKKAEQELKTNAPKFYSEILTNIGIYYNKCFAQSDSCPKNITELLKNLVEEFYRCMFEKDPPIQRVRQDSTSIGDSAGQTMVEAEEDKAAVDTLLEMMKSTVDNPNPDSIPLRDSEDSDLDPDVMQVVNYDNPASIPLPDTDDSDLNPDAMQGVSRGGKRKIKNKMYRITKTRKLYKKYKNKLSKKRNKRVRKTKKRQIKRKRITRRR